MPSFDNNVVEDPNNSSFEVRSSQINPLIRRPSAPPVPNETSFHQSNPIASKNFYSSIHCEYYQNNRVNAIAHSPDGLFMSVGSGNLVTVYRVSTHDVEQEYVMDKCVNAIAYSTDGILIAIGGDDQKVTIYKSSTHEIVYQYPMKGEVNAIQFSPNRNFIAVGGGDKKLTIFDTTTHAMLKEHNILGRVYAIAWAPDSVFISVGGFDNKVTTYNMFTHEMVKEYQRSDEVYSIEYSRDGTCIAVGDEGGKVIAYNTSSHEVVCEYERSNVVSALSFSPDGNFLAVGGCDKMLTIYNQSSGVVVKEYKISGEIHAIEYSPNGDFISVGGDDEKVTVYHSTSYQSVQQYQFSDTAIYTIATSPDGKVVALGVGDGKIIICSMSSFEVIQGYQIGGDVVIYAMDFSPNGQFLAVGGDDEKVTVYDTNSNQILRQYKRSSVVSALAYSRDGRSILVGGHDETITVYCTSSNEIIQDKIQVSGKVYTITCSDESVAVGADEKITIYNSNYEIVHEHQWNNPVYSIAYAPDSSFITIGGSDGTISFLDVDDWKTSSVSPIYFPQSVVGISFVNGIDRNINADFFTVAVANGNILTTMMIHNHTVTPPEVLLRFQDDDKILDLIKDTTNNISGLTLNDQGTNLVSYAAKKDRIGLLLKMLNNNPSDALIPNTKTRSNGIMRYLEEHYLLSELNTIADGKDYFKTTTSSTQLNEMVEVLINLANNQVKSSVTKILNAGEKDSIEGFIIVGNVYVLAKIDTPWWSSAEFSTPLALQVPPRSTCKEYVYSTWYDLKRDDKKRVQLKVLRVLLPDLASFETLKALTKYEDNKPFDTLSLRAAIDANWSKWARNKFLLQLFFYVFWLGSFSVFCDMTKQSGILLDNALNGNQEEMTNEWIKISTGSLVMCGVVYLGFMEIRQIKTLSMNYYWSEEWNTWQWIAKILTTLTVLIRSYFFSYVSESTQGICSAFGLLFTWVGLFKYLRGFEEVAWIVTALYRIAANMIYFILVLFLLMFGFSMSFRAMYEENTNLEADTEPVAFGSIVSALKTTFFAGILGDFDLDNLDETYSSSLSLIFMIVLLVAVSVIALNAMITFIGEKFESVLNERNATLKRQKAKVILDLYCYMGKENREIIERENRWVSMVVPSADLGLDDEPYVLSNVARATKDDIMKIDKKITIINNDVSNMQEETRKEINMMKKDITEIKNMITIIAKAVSNESQEDATPI